MREMPASYKTLIIALLVIVLDWFTKYLVVSNLAMTDVVNCCRIFNLVHVENHGVAFGMFGSVNKLILIGLSLCVLGGFLFWVNKTPEFWLPSGLIVGGAIGNLIDRINRGVVIDFLDFHLEKYHWPAFNVADSAIVIAVALIVFEREKK